MSVFDSVKRKNGQILNQLKKPGLKDSIDDLGEFVNTLQSFQIILTRLSNKYESNPVNVAIGLLDAIENSLEMFESKLLNLEKQGRLVRFLTNNRLRRQLDRLNSTLCLQLTELENDFLKESSSSLTSSCRLTCSNVDSVTDFEVKLDCIWNQLFGEQNFIVTWNDFVSILKSEQKIEMTLNQEEFIHSILDNANTGIVNRYKFAEFLKGFGPLEQCVQNVDKLLNEKWFHGFMTFEEAKKYLEFAPVGVFLVRFSGSRPGSFAIDYVTFSTPPVAEERYGAIPDPQTIDESLPKTVLSVMVESFSNFTFKVRQANAQQNHKVFKSVHEVIKHYYSILQKGFTSTLPKEPWFFGDVSAEEAEELLSGKPEGTFLLRFSSKSGCFASSYVLEGGKIGKSLIKPRDNKLYIENSADTNLYPSLNALVDAYPHFFKYPCPIDSPLIVNTLRRPVVKKNPIQLTNSSPIKVSSYGNLNSVTESKRTSVIAVGPVKTWSVQQVCTWLIEIGLPQYIESFKQNQISGVALLSLSEPDMKELGVLLGHRKIITSSLAELNNS